MKHLSNENYLLHNKRTHPKAKPTLSTKYFGRYTHMDKLWKHVEIKLDIVFRCISKHIEGFNIHE